MNQYNEQLVKTNEDSLNIAWQLYTSQLKKVTLALNWSSEVRQEAWDKGHALMTSSVYDYADRKKELRAEKLRKKAAEAKVGVKELIDLAGQIDITGDPRDIEELIGENKKQADALDSIPEKTGELELIEEMAVLKARLTTSSKKLRQQRDEMLDQGKSGSTFSRKDPEVKPKLSSGH